MRPDVSLHAWRSLWPICLLAAVIVVSEGSALMGHGRLLPLYSDSLIGLALVGVRGTLGLRVAFAAWAVGMAYIGWHRWPSAEWFSHVTTLAAVFGGVIVMVDRFLRRLADQQASMEEAQALAKVGSWSYDPARDRGVVSAEARRMFGFRPGEAVSLATTYAQIVPEDLPLVQAAVDAALTQGRDFVVTYRIPEGGRLIDVESRGHVKLGADGRCVRIDGTVQDITERRDAERAITASHERLVALDRMKDDFVNSVSHELRTPLTAVKGYLEFLADELGGPLTPSQASYVANARAGAARLERLVDDLLDFALLEAGEFRLVTAPTDVTAVAGRVLGMLGGQALERDVTLTLEASALPRPAVADEARVEQVLINLVGNALKFTPAGGRVTVRLGHAPGADALRVDVVDTGPGLPPEAQARLFEKFYRLRRAGDVATGTGLGLAITKHLVEAHGGAIGVDSAPGAGSTFWFVLPLGPAPSPLRGEVGAVGSG